MSLRPISQGGDAGQFFALEKLQAGAPARAHKADLVAELSFVQRFDAVPAADNALGAAFLCDLCDGARYRIGPFGEPFVLEQSHWSVPQNRFGLRDFGGVNPNRGGPDIQAGGIRGAIQLLVDPDV